MYNVESVFTLEDKVSPALKKLCDNLNKADKDMQKFQARVLGTNALLKIMGDRLVLGGQAFGAFGRSGAHAGSILNTLDKQTSLTNAALQQMGARTIIAGQGFMFMARHGSQATSALAGVNRQMQQTASHAQRAVTHMNALGHAMRGFGRGVGMGIGIPIGGGIAENIGQGVAALVGGSIKGGMAYDQSLKQLQGTGQFSPAEQKQAERLARQMSRSIPTTTMSENLKTISEVSQVTGSAKEGMEAAPMFARASQVIRGASGTYGGSADEMNQTLAKIFEKRGVLFNSKGQFQGEAAKRAVMGMVRTTVASAGMLKPEAYQQVLNTMGEARYGAGNEFMEKALPVLIAENARKHGGSGQGLGQGIAGIYQGFVLGQLSLDAIKHLQAAGMLPSKDTMGKAIDAKALVKNPHFADMLTDTGGHKIGDLARTNQFEFAQKIKEGALKFSGQKWDSMSQDQKAMLMPNFITGTTGVQRTGRRLMSEWMVDEGRLRKEMGNVDKVKSFDELEKIEKDKTENKLKQLHTSWENLNETLGRTTIIMNPLGAGLDRTTDALNKMSDFIDTFEKKYPATTKALTKLGDALGFVTDKFLEGTGLIIAGAAEFSNDAINAMKGVKQAIVKQFPFLSSMFGADPFTPGTMPKQQGFGAGRGSVLDHLPFAPGTRPAQLGAGPGRTPIGGGGMPNQLSGQDLYFAQLLDGLQLPVTPENLHFMRAWKRAEGGSADNPFNTTRGAPGARTINHDGVKRYPNIATGLEATRKTLAQKNMAGIRAALAGGHNEMGAAAALKKSPWGTGGLVEKILSREGTLKHSIAASDLNLPLAAAGAMPGASSGDALQALMESAGSKKMSSGAKSDIFAQLLGMNSAQAQGKGDVQVHFHGPVYGHEKVLQAVKSAVAQAHMKAALNHSVTAQSTAGGTINTPELNGR